MQAAANRLAGPQGNRRRATPGAQAHVASMDDAALLGALPDELVPAQVVDEVEEQDDDQPLVGGEGGHDPSSVAVMRRRAEQRRRSAG